MGASLLSSLRTAPGLSNSQRPIRRYLVLQLHSWLARLLFLLARAMSAVMTDYC